MHIIYASRAERVNNVSLFCAFPFLSFSFLILSVCFQVVLYAHDCSRRRVASWGGAAPYFVRPLTLFYCEQKLKYACARALLRKRNVITAQARQKRGRISHEIKKSIPRAGWRFLRGKGIALIYVMQKIDLSIDIGAERDWKRLT